MRKSARLSIKMSPHLGVILLLGCASNSAGTTDGCSWTRTITVAPADVLTAGTAAEILEHDVTRAKVCGP